jgi:hypothetical protein
VDVFGEEGDRDWSGIRGYGASFVDPIVKSGPRTTCVAGEGFLDGAESPPCVEEIAYTLAELLGVEIVQVDGFTFGEVLSTG